MTALAYELDAGEGDVRLAIVTTLLTTGSLQPKVTDFARSLGFATLTQATPEARARPSVCAPLCCAPQAMTSCRV